MEGLKRVRVENKAGHPSHFIVTRFRSSADEVMERKEYQVYGMASVKNKEEEP